MPGWGFSPGTKFPPRHNPLDLSWTAVETTHLFQPGVNLQVLNNFAAIRIKDGGKMPVIDQGRQECQVVDVATVVLNQLVDGFR